MADVVVIGAGPAGLIAALCAADLGARVALVARTEFGGMMANDGPVPVRTLSQAARLIREARELGRFGVAVSESVSIIAGCWHGCAKWSTMCVRMLPCASGSMRWE